DAAAECFMRSLAILEKNGGLTESFSAHARQVVAFHLKHGRIPEGLELSSRMVSLLEKQGNIDDRLLGKWCCIAGGILRAQGRSVEALALLDRGVRILDHTQALDHRELVTGLNDFGLALRDVQRYSE